MNNKNKKQTNKKDNKNIKTIVTLPEKKAGWNAKKTKQTNKQKTIGFTFNINQLQNNANKNKTTTIIINKHKQKKRGGERESKQSKTTKNETDKQTTPHFGGVKVNRIRVESYNVIILY